MKLMKSGENELMKRTAKLNVRIQYLNNALLADPKVLSRATKTVASSINDKTFQAMTAVLVTYVNVTEADRTVLFLNIHKSYRPLS